jgi:hypothetical protein
MRARRIRWTLAVAFVLGCDANPSDPEIERSVALRLASDTSLRGTPIEVSSVEGEIWLLGRVSSHDQRARAEAIAERVRGVDFVRNHLEVAPRRRPISNASELGQPGQPLLIGTPGT